MTSLPSRPAPVSEPAFAQMTSPLVVPTSVSSAAVPEMVCIPRRPRRSRLPESVGSVDGVPAFPEPPAELSLLGLGSLPGRQWIV